MDVLIIEDELPAQQILIRLIKQYFPDFNIIGALDSVKAAAKYLQDNSPDLIFMDVELSDGKCFEIFRQTDIPGVRSSSPPHTPTMLWMPSRSSASTI